MGKGQQLYDSSIEENEEHSWLSADEENQVTGLAEESIAQGDNPTNLLHLMRENIEACLGHIDSLQGTLELMESEALRQRLRTLMLSSYSPLKEALCSGEPDSVSFLLDLFAIHPQQSFPMKEMLAMNIAAARGRNAIVQLLLDRGADINASMEEDKRTPLFEACCHDHISTVKYLLERGADPNICDASKVSCLDVATKKGNTEMVQILLDGGAIH